MKEFEKIENESDLKEKQINRVQSFFRFLVVNAVAEQVENFGAFCFDSTKNSTNCEKLNDEIVEKFFVQIIKTKQTNVGGWFDVEFNSTGQVAEVLNQYNMSLSLKIDVENSTGYKEETFHTPESVKRMGGIEFPSLSNYKKLDLSKISSLADSLQEIQLFLMLSLKQIR